MEFFHRMFLCCLAGMVLSLMASAILFVRLEIPKVVGYLTGSRAAREIRRLSQGETAAACRAKRQVFREERMDETDVLEK